MRLDSVLLSKLAVSILMLVSVAFLGGCSGGDEPEEPVKAEEEEKEQPAEAEPKEEAAAESEPEAEAEADPAAEPEPEPAAEVAPTSAEPAGFDGSKVWKYVTSFALNVRNAPDKDSSSVVRHVKWGDKVEVVINGEWAKLATGEYVSSKHLSDSDPALKHSKGKKTKKKGK